MGFRFSACLGLLVVLLLSSLMAPPGRSQVSATCSPNDAVGETDGDHTKPGNAAPSQTDTVTGFEEIDIVSACVQEDTTVVAFTFVLGATPAPQAATQTWKYTVTFQNENDTSVTCVDTLGGSAGVTGCTAATSGNAVQLKFDRNTIGRIVHDVKFHTQGTFITGTGSVLVSTDDAPNTGTLFPKSAPYQVGARAPATVDSDHDGVPDQAEIKNGTDPRSFDSDHDGLLDGGNVDVPSSSSNATRYKDAGILLLADDGTTSRFAGEANFNTNATNPDTDGDGVLDGPNVTVPSDGNVSKKFASLGLQPTARDGGMDTYLGEYPFGTDPTKLDTDGEGLRDVQEITGSENQRYNNQSFYAGHPGSTNANAVDTDGDGLSDEEEVSGSAVINGTSVTFSPTNPNVADTDGDGLTDFEELSGTADNGTTHFHPTDPTKADTDGDGVNDGPEVRQHSDPTDPNSKTGGNTGGGGAANNGSNVSYLLLSTIAMLIVGLLCVVGILVRWG